MKIRKFLNFIYTILLVASMLCVFGWAAFSVPLETSASENRTLNSLKKVAYSLSSFTDGTMQASMETAISDQFPEREQIVRSKKRMERYLTGVFTQSESPYLLFKMPDIEIYELSNSGWMINTVGEATEEKTKRYTERAEQINALQLRHPNASVYVFYPTQMNETSLFDQENGIKAGGPALIKLLEQSLKVPFKAFEIPDLDTYHRCFFRSDHHPTNDGADEFYQEIMTMIGKQDSILRSTSTSCREGFYGTFGSRTGYVADPDTFCINEYDLPTYQIFDESGKDVTAYYTTRHDFTVKDFSTVSEEYPYYYGYAYASFKPIMQYYTGKEDLGNCLIVGDSYAPSVSDLLAANYDHTWLLYPYLYTQEHHTLFDYDHFIEDNKIDTVIYMLTGENYYYADQYEDRFQETLILPNGGNY